MSVDYTKIFRAWWAKNGLCERPVGESTSCNRAKSLDMIDSARMAAWKKIGVVVLVACAFTLGAALLVIGVAPKAAPNSASTSTPPLQSASPWNSHAIEGSPVGIRVQEIDPTHAAVVFVYDLENATDTDYRLARGPNIVIMSRLRSGGTLSGDEQIALDSAAFVPARNRTRIALEVNHAFNWPGQKTAYAERMFDQLVMGDVSQLAGFVLFDQANRYEIDFPAAWPQTHAPSATP